MNFFKAVLCLTLVFVVLPFNTGKASANVLRQIELQQGYAIVKDSSILQQDPQMDSTVIELLSPGTLVSAKVHYGASDGATYTFVSAYQFNAKNPPTGYVRTNALEFIDIDRGEELLHALPSLVSPFSSFSTELYPRDFNNLMNGGTITSDGSFYYMPKFRDSRYRLFKYTKDLREIEALSDNSTSLTAYAEGYVYYIKGAERNNTFHRLCRAPLYGGEESYITSFPVCAYFIDGQDLYYAKKDVPGIYKADLKNENASKISDAKVPYFSEQSLLMVYDNMIYYIDENEDRCLYKLSLLDGTCLQITSEPVRQFVLAQISNSEVCIIYSKYNKDRESLPLRAISLDGNFIPALTELQSIRSHYFNSTGGYLYYCDIDKDCNLYKLDLKNPNDRTKLADIHATRIFLEDEWIFAMDKNRNADFFACRMDGTRQQHFNCK